MTEPSDNRAAHEALREQFREAARRDSQPIRRKRRVRRGAIVVVAAILTGAAAAGAAQLISAGDPLPDPSPGEPYRPATPNGARLVATAADPEAGAKWGVGVYDATNGQRCAIAGQVRGYSLGLIENGTFHPYERSTTGACAKLSRRLPVFHDLLVIKGPQPRTIVYGRTRPSQRRVTAEAGGKRHSARPAAGGGFLFVYEGTFDYNDVNVTTAKG